VPVPTDVGHALRVKETASNAGGSDSPAESAGYAVVTAVGEALPAGTSPSSLAPTPVVVSTRSATIDRHGDAWIPVTCPETASAGCRGTVTITVRTVEAHARRARALAALCGRGCRPLAKARYQARAGQTIRIRVHIASYGRHLLTQRRTLRATLTGTTVSGGKTATVVRTLALTGA